MAAPNDPERTPGERRLGRPPSGRSAPADGAVGDEPAPGSLVRAAIYGDLVAVVGAAAIVVLAGVLTIGAGLLVVAVAIGRFVGLAVRAGGRGTLPQRVAVALAVITTLGAVGLGQIGTWLLARSEGGVLGLVDHLGQAHGWLVPAQFAIAAAVAWWTAR